MKIDRPELERIWASNAPVANVEDPDITSPGKFSAGWTAEVPTYQNFNFLQKHFTQSIAYLGQMGIAEWDGEQEYHNGSVTTRDNILRVNLGGQSIGEDPLLGGGWAAISVYSFDTVDEVNILDLPENLQFTLSERGGASFKIMPSSYSEKPWDIILSNGNKAALEIIDDVIPAAHIGAKTGGFDNTVLFQAALDEGITVALKSGATYSVTDTLVPKRGGGFVTASIDYYPDTPQGLLTFKGARIIYNGVATADAVIRASKTPIGTPLSNAFTDSIFGFNLKNVVIDGNDLADYGVYAYRLQNGDISGIVCTRTNKHGFYATAIYNGRYSQIMGWRNNGCGVSFGRGSLDFGFSAELNAADIVNIWGFSNGYDGTFDETTNPYWGYGVGIFTHRGNFIRGVRAENNDGANCIMYATSSGTTINQVYTELGNSLNIGNGETAISQGRSSRKYGIFYIFANSSGFGNSVNGAVLSNEFLKIIGPGPDDIRDGTPFTIEKCALCSGVVSDTSKYLLKDCNPEMTSNIIGNDPLDVYGNVNGIFLYTGRLTRAYGKFDATSGSINTLYIKNASVNYISAGLYDISFDTPLENDRYQVNVEVPASNRACYISTKSANGFRIGFTNLAGTATDASAVLSFEVNGVD